MADYVPGQPMEEILASIKRIIAEDAPPPRAGGPAAPAAAADEVLELGVATPLTGQAEEVRDEALVSAAAENASRQAFAALGAVTVDPHAGANTLDGLVRELLRPMLRDWLDTNLPAIVERMVAREIARLGGR